MHATFKHTAIDRVIRSLTFKHPAPPHELADAHETVGDDATAVATRLLANYRGQLAQRVSKAS